MNTSIGHGFVVRCIVTAGLLLVVTNAAWADGAFTVPAGERQLFLDDHGIAKIENLKRMMHQPDKKGAVIRAVWPKGERSVRIMSAPCWDPDKRVFLFGVNSGGSRGVTTVWESGDGLQWHRKAASGLPFYTVLRDPTDPDPSRRYKSLKHTGRGGLAPWVSPDMVSWRKLDVPEIPSEDEYNLSLDEKKRLFIVTPKCDLGYDRAVSLSTSKDFEHWTRPELVFHADELDQKLGRENIRAHLADPTLQRIAYNNPATYEVSIYNMGVFRYEGLYVGMPAMYHAVGPVPNYPNTVGFHQIQLVCSRDLRSWKRLGNRGHFIGPSPLAAGAYDLQQILPPTRPIVRAEKLWLYYTGSKYRGTWKYVGKYPHGKHVPLPGFDPDRGAICLAVLRRDGFISLDAGKTEGTIVTKPFRLPADKLFVNVDAFKGQLCIEVLNTNGKVVAVSEPMKGDLLRGEVEWQKGNIAALQGKAVSLRFILRNGSLYSYWLQ